MIKKTNAPGSTTILQRDNMNKCFIKHNLLSFTGNIKSKIKVLLIEMCCRGYLSERLTKAGFKFFRLKEV